MATAPTVAAVATLEPDVAAKPAQVSTLAMASPPGMWPTHLRAMSNSLRPTPA